jgi:hypothetical protein
MTNEVQQNSVSIPQIEIGKSPGQPLNVRILLPLPANTPFGNFQLKYMLIVQRLDHVNSMLPTVFESYERAMAQPMTNELSHQALVTEQVIYWLRKTADELIGLYHVLASRAANGEYPDRVSPDSIGGLLSKTVAPPFVEHMDFLKVLNEISNAYKHSFINSDLSRVGRDEPVVLALGLDHNRLKKDPKFYAVSVRDVVSDFNAFLSDMVESLRACGILHNAPLSAGGGTEGI